MFTLFWISEKPVTTVSMVSAKVFMDMVDHTHKQITHYKIEDPPVYIYILGLFTCYTISSK